MVCAVSAWPAKPMPPPIGLIAAAMVPPRLSSWLITAVGMARHSAISASAMRAVGASLMMSDMRCSPPG